MPTNRNEVLKTYVRPRKRDEIREAAEAEGKPVAEWLRDACRLKLRRQRQGDRPPVGYRPDRETRGRE